ncbi:MAG TPA: hypothetical protein ENJ53_06475, partial [Phaeodactylibacter sp.]|nr:hypothetical protein [Phaeodactylibacter sp.]
MKKSLCLILILFGLSAPLFSQNSGVNYNLLLQQGEYFVAENWEDFLEKNNPNSDEIIEGKYYRILQFFQIPTNEERADLEKLGIAFLNFFPNKAYLVSFPKNINKQSLKNRNIRAVIRMEGFMKKDKSLVHLDFTHQSVHQENVEVMLRFFQDVPMDWAIAAVRQKNAKILKPMRESHLVKIEIPINDIDKYAALPYVSFISIAPTVGEPEDRRGR